MRSDVSLSRGILHVWWEITEEKQSQFSVSNLLGSVSRFSPWNCYCEKTGELLTLGCLISSPGLYWVFNKVWSCNRMWWLEAAWFINWILKSPWLSAEKSLLWFFSGRKYMGVKYSELLNIKQLLLYRYISWTSLVWLILADLSWWKKNETIDGTMDAHEFGMLKPSIMIPTCSFFHIFFLETRLKLTLIPPYSLPSRFVTDEGTGLPSYQLQYSEKLVLLLPCAAQ